MQRPHSSTPPPTPTTAEAANAKLAEAAETEVATQTDKQHESDANGSHDQENPSTSSEEAARPSAYVWIGSSKSDDNAASAPIDEFNEETLASRDGIGIV